jgi:hypothetical protein
LHAPGLWAGDKEDDGAFCGRKRQDKAAAAAVRSEKLRFICLIKLV